MAEPTDVEAGASPPGYPVELEHLVLLADGRQVLVRPVRPSDAAQLAKAIATADADTLRARFLGSPPHDEATIRGLVTLDYVHRLALVAFAPDGSGVGIARYEGEPGKTSAEVAVVVDPAWRRVGLGELLLRDLGEAALHRGIERFTALVLADNAPVLGLLRASGLAFSVEVTSGTSEIVMQLEGPVAPVTPTQGDG